MLNLDTFFTSVYNFYTRYKRNACLYLYMTPTSHVLLYYPFNQPRPSLRTLTETIDLTKALDMVNQTKLIHALNYTLSPSFHDRVGVSQGSCKSPTLFNFYISTFPQTDDFLTSSYADGFTVSCSNSNVNQMVEALSAHSSNIEEWSLAISAPKSTITLFTP